MRIKWTFAILAVTALAALGVAACGDDDDDGGDTTAAATTQAETTAGGGGGGAGGTVQVRLALGVGSGNQTTLSAPAGTVTVDYTNPQPISHDVTIEDSSGQEIGGTDLVSDGTAEATVDLQPGSYTFFCSVPGHREAGMEGTLTVQ